MKVKEGKIYKFKSSKPISSIYWGKKVKILETKCDLPLGATSKARLVSDGRKIDCYENDFVPIKNNIIKI